MAQSSKFASLENLPPDVMKSLNKELVDLVANPLEGISVQVDEKNVTDISAIIEGPNETPYSGGRFQVKLVLPRDFPQAPPRGHFLTRIFHPNVAQPSGEICVNTLQKDWNPALGIKHILLTIKCLLIVPNPESALNEEAGRLLLEDYDSYARRARMITDIHAKPHQTADGSSSKRTATAAELAKAKEKSRKLLKRL